jgi:hypothetical protein
VVEDADAGIDIVLTAAVDIRSRLMLVSLVPLLRADFLPVGASSVSIFMAPFRNLPPMGIFPVRVRW